MPRALVRKHRNSLWPAEPRAEDLIAKIKDGAALWIEWKRLKSPKQMALYFIVLSKVYDALPERFGSLYPSFEIFRKSLEMLAGFGDPLHSPEGELIAFAPRSVRSAGQDEFNDVFKGVMDAIYKRILPEIGSVEFELQIDRMLADKRYDERNVR